MYKTDDGWFIGLCSRCDLIGVLSLKKKIGVDVHGGCPKNMKIWESRWIQLKYFPLRTMTGLGTLLTVIWDGDDHNPSMGNPVLNQCQCKEFFDVFDWNYIGFFKWKS